MQVHYSSAKDDWRTPRALYERLDEEFGFDIDVCASDTNAQCERFWTKDDDALAQSWSSMVCWMNPPYGRGMDRWVLKAVEEMYGGATVVCLVPARLGSRWFRLLMREADELRFMHSRLTFEGAAGAAPFPSCVAVLRARPGRRIDPADFQQERCDGWFTVRASMIEETWL